MNRTQFVEINKKCTSNKLLSSPRIIRILGWLLFFIYINDLNGAVTDQQFFERCKQKGQLRSETVLNVKGKQNSVKLNQAELILTWGMGGNYGNKNRVKLLKQLKGNLLQQKKN